mmetsp:Transcript_9544/g.27208  ORF Transcript_9544/g.27208 Transcript_9544/m.27208 type:complete len:204 (+) Transcript_9544:936-1547(+)
MHGVARRLHGAEPEIELGVASHARLRGCLGVRLVEEGDVALPERRRAGGDDGRPDVAPQRSVHHEQQQQRSGHVLRGPVRPVARPALGGHVRHDAEQRPGEHHLVGPGQRPPGDRPDVRRRRGCGDRNLQGLPLRGLGHPGDRRGGQPEVQHGARQLVVAGRLCEDRSSRQGRDLHIARACLQVAAEGVAAAGKDSVERARHR